MTLLWLTAWWLTIIDDTSVTDCMVTDHHWWPYCDCDCTVTNHHWWPYCDCMVTDHHWWPYCDWLHGDWSSLIYPTVTLIAKWLTIIDDPSVTDFMVTDHHWFTLLWLIARWLTIIDDPSIVWNHFFQTFAKMASGLKQVLAKMKYSSPTNTKYQINNTVMFNNLFCRFWQVINLVKKDQHSLKSCIGVSSSSISMSSSFKF